MRRFFKKSRSRVGSRGAQPGSRQENLPVSNTRPIQAIAGIDSATERVWSCFGHLYLELLAVERRQSSWADFTEVFHRLRPEIEASVPPEARTAVKQELDHAEREMKRRHTAQTHHRLHEAALRAL
ncbi:hypothetical protein BH20GEM3_BH20GEM3_14490 [soil metagenome]|jgi:hypothetical protein